MSQDPNSSRNSLGPYIVVAACLMLGVLLILVADDPPSMVISVLLGCGIAALLYGILGGVSVADFNLGPLKFGGSAAVLLGGTWLINNYLDPQMATTFDASRDVKPALTAWYAIDRQTGEPTRVAFNGNEVNVPPDDPLIPFELKAKDGGGRAYMVKGKGAEKPLGLIAKNDITDTVGIVGANPVAIWGPQSLYMPKGDVELSDNQHTAWGNRTCSGTALPLRIRVVRLGMVEEDGDDGHTHFEVTPCNSTDDSKVRKSSLKSDQGEMLEIEFGDNIKRRFIVAVISARHTINPPWSRFVVIELE